LENGVLKYKKTNEKLREKYQQTGNKEILTYLNRNEKLQKFLDRNQDGEITFHEYVFRFAILLDNPDHEFRFEQFDSRGDNKAGFDEFMLYAEAFAAYQKKENKIDRKFVEKIYQEHDQSNKGYLNKQELGAALLNLKFEINHM
jgi:Ca2+-binding EF-hand superfamily protein